MLEPASSSSDHMNASQPEVEAEDILQQEERELQELIALIDDEESQHDSASQHFGSDDEDYDQIFMECTADSDFQQISVTDGTGLAETHAVVMDMSEG